MTRTVTAGKKTVELADNEVMALQELDSACRRFIRAYEEANSAGMGALLRASLSEAVGLGKGRQLAAENKKRIKKLRESDQKSRLEYAARDLCDRAGSVFGISLRYPADGRENKGLIALVDDRSEEHWLINRKGRKEALAEFYIAAKRYVDYLEKGEKIGPALIALNGEGNQVRNQYRKWAQPNWFLRKGWR